MLSSILNDPEKMKSIMSIASSVLGQNPGTGGMPFSPPSSAPDTPFPPPSSAPDAPFSPPPPPETPAGAFQGTPAYDPSAELMAKMIPVISAIAKSGKNAVNRDKMNLLLSLKPFVTSDIGNQMDHAIRLLSTARMAKAAMGQLGNVTSSDGKMEL